MIGRLPAAIVPLAWRGLLVLAATTALIAEMEFPWEQPSETASTAPAGAAELRHAGLPPQTAYPAIAQHPLFYPSRAPWAPAPEPPAVAHVAMPAPTGYALAGLILSGSTRSAILKTGGGAKTMTISEGDSLGGWTLRRIDAAGLHFELDGRTFDLAFPR
jgi:hypothetical protein